MDPIYAFETTVDFQRTTRLYIPEDKTILNHEQIKETDQISNS
jgi:hypothetical protein